MTDETPSDRPPLHRLAVLDRAADHSLLLTAGERVRTAIAGSQIAALAARLPAVAKGSWVYRWLTKEPDPDVIVIDLRETATVGPILTVLDRLLDRVAPYWEVATTRRLLRRGGRLLERAGQTRMGRRLSAAFEPPDGPPNNDH